MTRIMKRKDFLKGYKVKIREHVIERYMERTGVSEKEARRTLERKFRDSRLTQLMKDGSEKRMERSGSLNKRLIFVAMKYQKTFVVITCYPQGARDSWWKNEGLVIEDAQTKEEYQNSLQAITEELETIFQEEVQHG